jgi:hypothetical protein
MTILAWKNTHISFILIGRADLSRLMVARVEQEKETKERLCGIWSSRGDRIAFTSEIKEGDMRLMIVSASGGEPMIILNRFETWCWPQDGISYYTDEFIKTRPSSSIWEVKPEELIKGKTGDHSRFVFDH